MRPPWLCPPLSRLMRHNAGVEMAVFCGLLLCFSELLSAPFSSSIPIPACAVVVLSAHVDATFQNIFQSLSAFGQIKLHAQYCAPRSWAKARAHEVFTHHFRLPRRGEKMAHLVFAMLLHSKKSENDIPILLDTCACRWQGWCHSRSGNIIPVNKKEPTNHCSAA